MRRYLNSWTCLALLTSACGSATDERESGTPLETLSRPLTSDLEATAAVAGDVHPALLVKLADPDAYDPAATLSELPSICGANDLQSVSTYDGSLGVSTAYVAAHKRAVGALSISNIPNADHKFCSGTLVSSDLFLTASHCVGPSTVTNFVSFNYEQGQSESFFPILEVVEDHPSLDLALIRLGGNPGATFGAAPIRASSGAAGEPIAIIQHPSGRPKEIEAGHLATSDGNRLSYADLDTEPGSSGSGILDARGVLIGVHTNGGCSPAGGSNSGTAIASALGISASISDLAWWRDPGIVWRHASGQVQLWFMDGGTIVSEALPGGQDPSMAWKIEGTGDFDGDRETDILWRHSTGQVAIWYLHRGTLVGEGYPGGADPSQGQTIQGVGYFDGGYRSDILWRDQTGRLSIWFDGNDVAPGFPSYQNAGAPVPLDWKVQGIGDFDGDRETDILWRNDNGQVAIWYLIGGAFSREGYPGGEDPSRAWEIQGVGDFDRDGHSDILWREKTGQLAIWFQGNDIAPAFPSYQNAGGPVHISHQVQAVADFDDDGRSDILWRDDAGQTAIWLMNGGQFVADAYPRWVDPSSRIEGAFDALDAIIF
ncbi:MAG TPA: trypsin-like peptidase domain-containing protein [Polyangiaceae bacterium]|nr:trypsin-like peptidase domain-containing protein [Polyangiaceae bacterium]